MTNLDLSVEVIWRIYRGRADCENRIKELKYDFAADSFCMKNFWATEAALNTVMLAYNLMSLFRHVLLKSELHTPVQHTLKTLRYKISAKAAYIAHESRKTILNLSLAMQHRVWRPVSGMPQPALKNQPNSPQSTPLEIPNGKSGLNNPYNHLSLWAWKQLAQ